MKIASITLVNSGRQSNKEIFYNLSVATQQHVFPHFFWCLAHSVACASSCLLGQRQLFAEAVHSDEELKSIDYILGNYPCSLLKFVLDFVVCSNLACPHKRCHLLAWEDK